MSKYDPELTFDANAAILFEALKLPERCFYGEALIEDFLQAAYEDGYNEASALQLAIFGSAASMHPRKVIPPYEP